ncbi:Ras GTPase tem1 [Elasticomyces elasticus]|nr:Ras GTPase tem1 [Elasticomyces elasticus]
MSTQRLKPIRCGIQVVLLKRAAMAKLELRPNLAITSLSLGWHEVLTDREDKFDGVNFMEKTISIRNTEITFSIWDLGGQREFVNMLPLVCNDAVAILFMFDLTRKSTLNSIKEWCRQGRGFNKTAIPFLMAGSLADYTKTASRLCSLCLNFTKTLGTDGVQFFKFKHHQSFALLEAAASKECDLCALLFWSIMRNAADDGYAEADALVHLHEHDSKGLPWFVLMPLFITQESDERRQLWYVLEYRRVTVWVMGWNTDDVPGMNAWATLSISPCSGDNPYIVGRIMKVPWDIAICRDGIAECSQNHA